MFDVERLDLLLDDALEVGVDRGHDGVPVLGRFDRPLKVRLVVQKSVFPSEISLKLAINFRACFEKFLLGNAFNDEVGRSWTFRC